MSAVQLERKLTLLALLVIGLAYFTQMAIFDTLGIITEITEGTVAGAYVITTLAVLLTV